MEVKLPSTPIILTFRAPFLGKTKEKVSIPKNPSQKL